MFSVVLCGAIFGSITYFAKAEDVRLVEMRLDQKIIQDRIDWLQQRQFTLQDRHGTDINSMPQSVKEEYRQVKCEIENLKEKLKRINLK